METFTTDAPTQDQVSVIETGLDEYNTQMCESYGRRPLSVLVRDPETGEVVGGLNGRTSLGVLFIDTFHLPRSLRGAGLGGKVLREAEDEARRRGCRNGVLYTAAFHAPGFYVRQGWRVFGEVPSTPPGASRFFMTKELGRV